MRQDGHFPEKKYYNANKVEAVFSDIRRQAEQLSAENEQMRAQLAALNGTKVETSYQHMQSFTVKAGDTVSLIGFGTFYVGERAARTGRNPRTGKTLEIKAAKSPKFRPGKGLKDAIQ